MKWRTVCTNWSDYSSWINISCNTWNSFNVWTINCIDEDALEIIWINKKKKKKTLKSDEPHNRSKERSSEGISIVNDSLIYKKIKRVKKFAEWILNFVFVSSDVPLYVETRNFTEKNRGSKILSWKTKVFHVLPHPLHNLRNSLRTRSKRSNYRAAGTIGLEPSNRNVQQFSFPGNNSAGHVCNFNSAANTNEASNHSSILGQRPRRSEKSRQKNNR